jgi:hypothetical protein
VQLEVEDWVRREWMPQHFGQNFYRERLRLTSGGVFDFDAVCQDQQMVASISTSGSKTASGKHAVGKLLKIRSDMFFLLLVNASRRIIVLTEADMYDLCLREKNAGRIPDSIEFAYAEIPSELAGRLTTARGSASREVLPAVLATSSLAFKTTHPQAAARQDRYTLFGYSICSVLRAMGKAGMTAQEAHNALAKTMRSVPNPTTIAIQVRAGKQGLRGQVAPLTDDQMGQLRRLATGHAP